MVKLTEEQEKTRTKLGVRKTLKLLRLTNNIRNAICNDCRMKFDLNKANLTIDEYCDDCKPMVEPKLKIIELMCK